MFYGILIALQMIISVLLVVAILLQSSKGGGLAGIAGGMMSSTVFGGRGAANFLSKATTILAALFMLNCLGMAMISTSSTKGSSVTQQAVSQESANSPVPKVPADGGEGGENEVPPPAPAPSGN
jgi:preprotein translocase subunit SecG